MTWKEVADYIEQCAIPEILQMMTEKRYFPYNDVLTQRLDVMMLRLQEARNQEKKEKLSA